MEEELRNKKLNTPSDTPPQPKTFKQVGGGLLDEIRNANLKNLRKATPPIKPPRQPETSGDMFGDLIAALDGMNMTYSSSGEQGYRNIIRLGLICFYFSILEVIADCLNHVTFPVHQKRCLRISF